jgi:hypothetical protein
VAKPKIRTEVQRIRCPSAELFSYPNSYPKTPTLPPKIQSIDFGSRQVTRTNLEIAIGVSLVGMPRTIRERRKTGWRPSQSARIALKRIVHRMRQGVWGWATTPRSSRPL